jgi:protoporphyrinogen IX oxidase
MLWIKTLHIIFMVTWFAGLFYLPRLFVYHAMSKDKISRERFKVMERKLFFGIMTPGAFLTILSGGWLWNLYGVTEQWLQIKIGLVILLLAYHYLCFKHLIDFKNNKNKHSHIYFRWFNEVPVIALVVIIYLVEFKPV